MDNDIDFEVGIQWEQTYSINSSPSVYYWTLDYEPYAKFSTTWHPTFKLDRLYAVEATVDVDEIETYVFAELLYFVDEKICFNVGGYYSDVLLTVKFAMSFKDCYKNIIYTFLDFSNLIGPDAKWLEECDSSSDEDVTIVSKTFYSETKHYWYGDDTYADCFEVASLSTNMYANFVFEQIKQYSNAAATQGKQTFYSTK